MGNTVLRQCRMEERQSDVNVNSYNPTIIQNSYLVRNNNNKKQNKANKHSDHNEYYSQSSQLQQCQSHPKLSLNQPSQSTQSQFTPYITFATNFHVRRSHKIQTIYGSLLQQKPISYSIQNQQFLQQFGVNSLIELCKKLSKQGQFREDCNLRLMRFDYLQRQVVEDLIDIDKACYKQRAISRCSSHRWGKQAFIDSTILTTNYQPYQPSSTTPSLYNRQHFNITNNNCIYIGYVNTSHIPHGSGQLYCFNKQVIHINTSSDYSYDELELFVEAEFDNGSIATGDCVIINRNGSCYRGGFAGVAMHGRGRVCQCDGLMLQGYFVNGLLSGKGNAAYPDHGQYKGHFHQGLREGKGTMTWKSQQQPNNQLTIIYDGYFKSDQMQGLGYLKTPNYEYWGPFISNMKQGKGTLKFSDGRKYEGWFQHDQISGYGELHYPDGYVEKGMFPLKEQ